MLLLNDKVGCEPEGRADVLLGYSVIVLHLLKRHPASQATHNSGDWHARSTDDWLTVLGLRIHDDSVSVIHSGGQPYRLRTHHIAAHAQTSMGPRP